MPTTKTFFQRLSQETSTQGPVASTGFFDRFASFVWHADRQLEMEEDFENMIADQADRQGWS
jgi:hypothetical protein